MVAAHGLGYGLPAGQRTPCYNGLRRARAFFRRREVARLLRVQGSLWDRGMQTRLAQQLGVSRATICRDVAYLLTLGQPCRTAGRGRHRRYRINSAASWAPFWAAKLLARVSLQKASAEHRLVCHQLMGVATVHCATQLTPYAMPPAVASDGVEF